MIIVFTLLNVLLVGSVGYLTYQQGHSLMIHNELNKLENSAQVEVNMIQGYLQKLKSDVDFMAHTPPIQGLIRTRKNGDIDPLDGSTEQEWISRLSIIFTQFLSNHPDYFQIRYIGIEQQGKEIVRAENRQGRIILTSAEELQAKGDREYFLRTLQESEGSQYISRINWNREHGELGQSRIKTIRVATPIRTVEGELFGIVVINVDLDGLFKKLGEALPSFTKLYLANQEGGFLLHPDSSQNFDFEKSDWVVGGKALPDFDKTLPELIRQAEITQEAALVIQGNVLYSQKIEIDLGKEKRFLGLALVAPAEILLREVNKVRERSFYLGAILLLLGVICIFLFSQHLTKPLRQMTDVVENFEEEGQYLSFPHFQQKEIASLADSFQLMTSQLVEHNQVIKKAERDLSEAHDKLEQRVEERTEELKQVNRKLLREMEAHRAANQRLELAGKVFENASEAIVITDVNNQIIDTNKAHYRITGYTREEMVGSNPGEFKSGRHEPEFYKKMWMQITEEGKWSGEIWDRRKDGESYLKWLTISTLKNKLGDVINYVGIFSDMSGIKQTEEKLRELAYYDSLTSLPNRVMFRESLHRHIKRAKRNEEIFALMYLDLDNFKYVNDSLGHSAEMNCYAWWVTPSKAVCERRIQWRAWGAMNLRLFSAISKKQKIPGMYRKKSST